MFLVLCALVIFEKRSCFMPELVCTLIFPFMLSAKAGLAGAGHYAQPFIG
jgi:hypothetical protein